MNHEEVTNALCGVRSMVARKDDPTISTDWDTVKKLYPDLQHAWLQWRLARLAFDALLQEKIDER